MTKARDLADAGTALTSVSATELGYVDGVTSAIQTQIDSKLATATASSTYIANSLVDAKADIITATADNTPARLAVGTDGQVLTADSTQSTGLKWSTPSSALTWTARAYDAENFYGIAYNGSNLYVAVGSAGILYSSSNGTTWTARTSGFGTNNINGVYYANSLFVAFGQNGTLTTSTDGITWTARTTNMGTSAINDVKYANSLWVAVGGGGGSANTGGITYSSDGITWTRKSQTLTVGGTYYTVDYNGTNWVVGATSSTNNYLYASTPSGTWTAGADGTGSTIYKIIWDGTRHIMNIGGGARYSTSTTIGTSTAYLSAHSFNTNGITQNAFYYNSKVYCVVNSRYGVFTPSSTTTPTSEPYGFVPGRITGASSVSDAWCIWVGSAGIIIGTDRILYTSF